MKKPSILKPKFLAETYNQGTVLIIAFIIMGVLILLGLYFLSFTLAESRIAKSQTVGTQTYYLAEAGINEAIWKLKNDTITTDGDDAWKDEFVATSTNPDPEGNYWSNTFVRNYTQDSTTTVSIQNFERAGGEIVATSTLALAKGKTAQRVVKTKASRALGSLTLDSPLFIGYPSGNIAIKDSILNVYNGNLVAGNNLNIQREGWVNVYDNPTTTDIQEGKVLVVGNCDEERINASSTCCADVCDTTSTCECYPDPEDLFRECEATPSPGNCPPDRKKINMPPIAWSSYYSKADQAESRGLCSVSGKKFYQEATSTLSDNCIFEEDEFEDLLEEVGSGGTLILEHRANGVATSTYYVKGEIRLGEWKHLEIHGVLVVEKSVYIGKNTSAYLTIIDPGLGIPSGLLTQKKMDFGKEYLLFQDIDVTGLLYSEEEMSIISIPHAFKVKGGIISRKLGLDSGWLDNPLNIYLDNNIIREGVWGGPQPPEEETIEYSSIVTIEYWEESY